MKKISCYTVLFFIISFILLGCKNGKEMSATTKIRFYTRGSFQEKNMWEKVTRGFMEKNSDIEVKIEHGTGWAEYFAKLTTMAAGNVAPDIIFMDSNFLPSYAEKGILLDLKPFIEKDSEVRMEDYYSETFKFATYKGSIYYLPDNIPVHVMYYNKDIFDEVGLNYPESNWSWSDFLEKAKRLTRDVDGDSRIDFFGFVRSPVEFWIFQNGGSIVDDDENPTRATFNSPEVIETLQFLADLRHKYQVVPGPSASKEEGAMELFMTGKVGMYIDGHWAIQEFSKVNFRWDVIELPRKKRKMTYMGGGGPSVTTQSKHPEAAWRFIKYLSSYEVQKEISTLNYSTPALKKVAKSELFLKPEEGRNMQAFLNSIPYGVLPPQTPAYIKLASIIWEETDLLWSGEATAKEIAEKINRRIDDALKSEKGWDVK